MIVAFSTSSPVCSVALIHEGRVLASAREPARQSASGVCLSLLDRCLADAGASLEEANGFAADLGPGSFTGVRVGVALAKTLAFATGRPAGGAAAFDLMSPGPAAVPARRGQWLLRVPGGDPVLVGPEGLGGAAAYGPDLQSETFPLAEAFARLGVALGPPEGLLPCYVLPPSISTPKRPGVVP